MGAGSKEKGTVIIVDDDSAVRDSLSLLLRTAGYATATCPSGEELLERSPPEGPACLLLDLQLPGADGIEIQQRLRNSHWEMPVLFLTGHGDVSAAVSALKGGAMDFVEKSDFDARKLVERVADAIDVHAQQMTRQSEWRRLDQKICDLSPRELEVARLASVGQTNKVIGLTLEISERTVEVHRGRAMRKLGLRTAAELARLQDRLNGGDELWSD